MKIRMFVLSMLCVLFHAILSEAQVGRWQLNNNANDASGNGYNGTPMGSPTFSTSSKEGSHALVVNGTSQYINLGNPALFPSGSAARTMSVWAMSNNVSSNRTIAAYGTANTGQAMSIGQNGTSLVAGAWADNFTITNFWASGVWHHICMTYDGTTAKLYADGVEVASQAKTWNLVKSTASIGRSISGAQYWSGSIDDVRVYNTALTATQVQALATPPPAAPTGLAVTPTSSTSANLSWTDASTNETEFQIERSTTSGTGFTLVNTAVANTVAFSNTGLTPGTTYYYRIRSANAGGASVYSSEVSVTTPATSIPTIPSGLTAIAASSTTINLSWTDASTNETGFQIERSTTAGSDFVLINTTAANVVTYSDATLMGGTTYYYRIRATNAIGSSLYTAEVASTTLSDINSPTGLTATALSATAIRLNWTDASNNETEFEIERSLTSTSGFASVGTVTADQVMYTDQTASQTTTYYYRVRAINATGNSPYSTIISATTPTLPNAPTTLAANAISANAITLTWVDASSNETGFQVLRSLQSGSGFVLVTTTNANVVSFTNSGLTFGTTYYYKLRAINAAGNSAFTTEAIATTTMSPPTAAAGLTVTPISSTSVRLDWTDASSTETGFQIERSLNGTSGFVLISTTSPNAASYLDNGLTESGSYFYRIRSISGGGFSSYTSVINVTTPISPPTSPSDLNAIASSPTTVVLSWRDNSTNEVEFEIERSTTFGSGFALVATAPSNAVSYDDSSLTTGNTYYYRIRTVNGGGASTYTADATVRLPIADANGSCENIFCGTSGGVGIGTTNIPTGYMLAVNGKIMAEGVKVLLQGDWPDYVFDNGYVLKEIPDLKKFIDANGHLPNVPSAKTIEEEGIDIGEINVVLLEKIEELSLYLIQMEERMKALELENEKLKEKNKSKR